MIPWVKDNGVWKKPSVIWGKVNGEWRSNVNLFFKMNGRWFEVGSEPYNKALALVGIAEVETLDAVLTNSGYCTALAGNYQAYTIMKDNYSTEMKTFIDSNFSNGLNLLNYKCKLKTYLFRNGNTCNEITGGFKWQNPNSTECAVVDNKLRLSKYSGDSHLWTNNKINMDGFSKLNWTTGTWRSGSNSWNKIGFDTSQSSTANYPFTAELQTNTTSTGSKSLDVSELTGEHYFKAVVYGISYLTLDNVFLESDESYGLMQLLTSDNKEVYTSDGLAVYIKE